MSNSSALVIINNNLEYKSMEYKNGKNIGRKKKNKRKILQFKKNKNKKKTKQNKNGLARDSNPRRGTYPSRHTLIHECFGEAMYITKECMISADLRPIL